MLTPRDVWELVDTATLPNLDLAAPGVPGVVPGVPGVVPPAKGSTSHTVAQKLVLNNCVADSVWIQVGSLFIRIFGFNPPAELKA